MTNPAGSNDTDYGRTYSFVGYPDAVSVTNFLNIVNAPAITRSAGIRAAECAVREENTWRAIEAEEGEKAALTYIAEAGKRYMKSRGELGTAVHHAIEHPERDCSPEVQPFLNAYLRWLERDKPEFVAQEVTVFNPEYGYAGTCDAILRLDGKLYAADWKSGFCPDKAALQVCSYARATHIRLKNGKAAPVPWGPVEGGFVLDLKATDRDGNVIPDGKFSVRFCDISDASWRAFRAAMCLWEFDQRRDVFGAQYRAS